jgi:hypothetical protein
MHPERVVIARISAVIVTDIVTIEDRSVRGPVDGRS